MFQIANSLSWLVATFFKRENRLEFSPVLIDGCLKSADHETRFLFCLDVMQIEGSGVTRLGYIGLVSF